MIGAAFFVAPWACRNYDERKRRILRNKFAGGEGLLEKRDLGAWAMANLADRLARGEPAAFAELYDACANRLYGYLVQHLGSPADAEDVVQETFARLARSRKKLRRVENLTAYAFAIARNEAARLKKRQAGLRRALEVRVPQASDAGDEAAALEAAEIVRAALDRLSPPQREVVELKLYADLTLREIAEVTGLPAGTVATRYRAAVEMLREMLARNQTWE